MAAIAQLKAVLGLDTKAYKAGIRDAENSTNKFGKSIASVGRMMGSAFTVAGIFSATRSIISLGSTITDLAKQAGLTTDEFQALERAAIKAGVAPELFRTAMSKLDVTLGQAKSGMKTYVDLFAKIGISQEKLQRMSRIEVIEQIAKVASTAARGSVEFGAAIEILGSRSGAQLLEVLEEINRVGMKGLIDDLKESSGYFEEKLLKQLDDLEDRLQLAKRNLAASGGAVLGGVMDVAEGIGRAQVESGSSPAKSMRDAFLMALFPLYGVYKASRFAGQAVGTRNRAAGGGGRPAATTSTASETELFNTDIDHIGHVQLFNEREKLLAKIQRLNMAAAKRIAGLRESGGNVVGVGQSIDSIAAIGGAIGHSRSGLSASDRQIRLQVESNQIQRDISRVVSQLASDVSAAKSAYNGGAPP